MNTGLPMFTAVFHTVPETTLDASELSSLVDATTKSNTVEPNDTDATSTGGLPMFTDVFHTVPETTLDTSELSSPVDATANSNTAEPNDTDAFSTPEHRKAVTVTTMSAQALVLALDQGDIPLASRVLAEYHASEAVRAVWELDYAKMVMQVYLIKMYPDKDMALAQRAGVVFTSAGLVPAINETRPKDFEPWCPRTKAYVSKRIDLAMNVVQQLLDMGVHRSLPTSSWLCYVLEFPRSTCAWWTCCSPPGATLPAWAKTASRRS